MVLLLCVCEFLNNPICFYIPGDPSKSSFRFGRGGADPLTYPSEDPAGGDGRGSAGKTAYSLSA